MRPHEAEAYFHYAPGGWVDNSADMQTSPDAPQSGRTVPITTQLTNNTGVLFEFHRLPLMMTLGLLTCPSHQPLAVETKSILQNGKRETRYQSKSAMAIKEGFPLAD